ncbi:MAG: hypothetical protein ABSH41_00040 [Syntrophobacteraceae bacterium]
MPNILKSYDIPIKTLKKNADQTNSGSFSSYFYKETPLLEYRIQSSRFIVIAANQAGAAGWGLSSRVGEAGFESHGDFFLCFARANTFRLSALFDVKKGKRLTRPT